MSARLANVGNVALVATRAWDIPKSSLPLSYSPATSDFSPHARVATSATNRARKPSPTAAHLPALAATRARFCRRAWPQVRNRAESPHGIWGRAALRMLQPAAREIDT